MKFSILTTALVCVSVVVEASVKPQADCLDAKRYNLESVCRKECAQEQAVAFSVSYDENNDSCRCYPNIEGLGTYTGSGDRDSRLTCYSMAAGEKTKVLDYGDCIIDSSNGGYGTKHTMQKCERGEQEDQADCVDKMRYNIESVCRKECLNYNNDSVAFAVSYAEDDFSCRCYPRMNGKYTGSGDKESRLTCYSMEGPKIKVLEYGDCVPAGIYGPHVTEHTMKRCSPVEKLLRGSATA